ncbi:MAG: S-adenosylmethionine:tRNA ribosyltransferase-isomerase [Bacteroidota bacterium]
MSIPNHIAGIRLSDYHYDLPEERIAQKPLNQRDQSKLLRYKEGKISHQQFVDLPGLLPENAQLFFNDTKVIQARLLMRRETGALIEILLLTPVKPSEVQLAMQIQEECVWHCMIGRKKRWKEGELLSRTFSVGEKTIKLEIELIDREKNWVRFRWDQAVAWVDLVATLGQLPLPPYINREVQDADADQYQTVYAEHEGAVAAPTAGLHFTEGVLADLAQKGISQRYLTLHVSAGTFLPVKHDEVIDHDMHGEQFVVSRVLLEELKAGSFKRVAVGTTSMRVLESLYWLGHAFTEGGIPSKPIPLKLDKLYPYHWTQTILPSLSEAMDQLLAYMDQHGMSHLSGNTEIFIMPGYSFQVCEGLITNYHMPETTLVLLVAAFVGEDWREIYEAALQNDYRFLSYGDSSLLWRT